MSRQPSLQSQNFTTTSASGSCVFLPSPIQPAPVMEGMIVSPTSGLPTPIMAPRRASSLAMAFGGGITVPTAATPVAPQPADHSTNTSTASATLVPGKATTTTTTKRRYSHNPYATSSASSNASDSSAPSTPLMGSFAGVPMSYMPSNGADAMGVDSSMPQHHHRVGSTFSTGVHLAPSHLQGHAQHGVDYFGYGPATQPLPAPISVPAGVVGGYGAAAASSVLASPTVAGCGVSVGLPHQRVQMLHASAGGSGVGVVGGHSGLAAALPPSAGPSSAAQSHLASPQAPMLQNGTGAAPAPGSHHHHHHHHGHALPHPHSHHHSSAHHGAHPTSVSGPSAASSAAAAGAMPVPTAMSIKAALEQFDPLRGQLPAAACTQRGRHAIVAVLRTMDPAATAACVAELKGAWGILIQDPNGCHVARTLVECIGDAQAAELASALTREEVHTMAAVSQHARRVLQALFERHRPAALQPIVEHIAAGAVGLAMTQQGCIGVMRVLEYADASQRALVLGALTPSLAQLAMDPFGNYVVQTIASSVERDVACAAMAHAFRGHWVRLACNKFASNVLEKVLRIATPIVRDALLEDICYSPAGLGVVIQDSFGNFVLQAVIESCQSGAELRRLGERIRPMLASSPYGHKIESKLKSKRLPMDM